MKYLLAIFLSFGLIAPTYASSKPAPKVDCSVKKNQKKLECKEAPKSDVKVEVKKPKKVDRQAPSSVKKKAEEKTKEK
jgi:diaminopimelate epimerase